MRATAVPLIAGITVFVIAVSIAIVVTASRGHVAANDERTNTDVHPQQPSSDGEGGSGDLAPEAHTAHKNPQTVFVHVVGEVVEPGVIELAVDSRVSEAIQQAGGATSEAALESVNLARIVTDGEQIIVPSHEQAQEQTASSGAGGGSSSARTGVDASHSVDGTGGIINLNTADLTALQTLPRIGPALAQRIIDWRESNGGFRAIEQLTEVSGIGAKTFEALRTLVTI